MAGRGPAVPGGPASWQGQGPTALAGPGPVGRAGVRLGLLLLFVLFFFFLKKKTLSIVSSAAPAVQHLNSTILSTSSNNLQHSCALNPSYLFFFICFLFLQPLTCLTTSLQTNPNLSNFQNSLPLILNFSHSLNLSLNFQF